ncbi:uncharacterized protein G2W53_041502 [Senna tora]|uniref:Uncharacterized protein n=1 Tax=Senna tora TaxID=362788 RepID=A0A834SFS3_9FABA|nr:uncharacterized protein G2W53_041502 [Senna tora]
MALMGKGANYPTSGGLRGPSSASVHHRVGMENSFFSKFVHLLASLAAESENEELSFPRPAGPLVFVC